MNREELELNFILYCDQIAMHNVSFKGYPTNIIDDAIDLLGNELTLDVLVDYLDERYLYKGTRMGIKNYIKKYYIN